MPVIRTDGQLYAHSAVCPHLGAVVAFNPAECSFDCPAHGSRFDARDGSCLNGPAPCGLHDVDAGTLADAHLASRNTASMNRPGPAAPR